MQRSSSGLREVSDSVSAQCLCWVDLMTFAFDDMSSAQWLQALTALIEAAMVDERFGVL